MNVAEFLFLLTETVSRWSRGFLFGLIPAALLAFSIQTRSIVADASGAELPEVFESGQQTAYANLSSDQELGLLLGYVVAQYPDHVIRYITKATDLQEGGLETRTFPDDQNKSASHPGMMFNDRALILVVDYRLMTAAQVAELNGILDSVRTYNGNTLSDSTRILVVVDESVLSGSGSGSTEAPGSDFWRRVNKIGQPLDISLLKNRSGDCLPTLDQYVNRHVWTDFPFDVTHLPTKTLDFAAGLPATDILSGGIELDSEGGLIFRDAALGESGNTLFILKDAPWQDIAFKVQLANNLASRGVDSGDRCLALPARFLLQRKDTSPGEMADILEAFGTRHRDIRSRWFPVNSVNFDLVFSGMTLRKGKLVKSGAVGNLKQNFEGVEVTSTLTRHQWQRLTGLLSDGGPLGSLALRVREKKQPFLIPDSLLQGQGEAVNGSQLQRLPGHWSLETLQQNYSGAHIEVISPSLDASGLLDTTRMESLRDRLFEQQPTGFYQALQSPGQVVITGLESNPGIQKLLESLLSNTPSVPGFGTLSSIHSRADIRVQWREPALAATTSWSNWLSQTSEPADESHTPSELSPSERSPSEPEHVNWSNPKQLVETVTGAIQNNTLVYLEGPPGSGKSYTANRVARSLAGQQTVYQLTTGPTSRREDLFGEQTLRSLPNRPDDSETRFAEGPILQWARQRSKDGEPVILILDEGNLLDKNIQVLLSGVTLKQPFISSNGDVYFLTPEHRLVITGNPLSFKGRHIIPELHNHAKTIRFAAMESADLSGQVIVPFLAAMAPQYCATEQCGWIADSLLENMAGYRKQLPDYPFSARDTLDVLSRFQFYLGDLTQKTTHEIEGTLKQSLYESFSGQLEEQARSAGLSGQEHHAFADFYERLKQQPTRLHFDNDSTRALAHRIWLELERVAGENNQHQGHPGRHGMMIEGPAGRGKDVVLDVVMKQWQEDWAHKGLMLPAPLRITAGYNNWDRLKAMIIQAKTEGRILIVSELNLLPTHFLEGVLNDVLTGEAAPGFFLFATVNPVQYSGRHAFSSALASRFTPLILDEYTLNDFKAIAASYSDSPFTDDIALWHYERVKTLKEKQALAVPAVMVMIEYLNTLNQSETADPNALRNRFIAHYRLYLKDGWRPEPIVVPFEADVVSVLEKEKEKEKQKEKEKASLSEVPLMTTLFNLFGSEHETSDIPEEPQKNLPASSEVVGASGEATAQNDVAQTISEEQPEKKTTDKQPLSFMTIHEAILKKGAALIDALIKPFLTVNDEPGIHAEEQLPEDNELDRQALPQPKTGQADRLPDGHFAPGQAGVLPDGHFAPGQAGMSPDGQFAPGQAGILPDGHFAPGQAGISPDGHFAPGQVGMSPDGHFAPEQAGMSPDGHFAPGQSDMSMDDNVAPGQSDMSLNDNVGPEPADESLDDHFDQDISLRLNKRFTSNFPPSFYRLEINRMKIHDNGKVKLEPFPAGELTPYHPESVQTDLSPSLQPGQHHGIQDNFKSGELTSLFPHETLVGIWTEDNRNQPIEVQYDALRGTYTVNLPESGHPSTAQLHYVVEKIKPQPEPEMAPVEAYQAPPVWIERLGRLLEERQDLARELRHNQNLSQKQRVEGIIAYVNRFTKPPKGVVSLENRQSDIEMLAELIERRIGACRHVAYAAAGLLQFYGIPVRVMFSETHAWVEYSLNNGKTWRTSETWGTYGSIENPEDFGDRSLISGHEDPPDWPTSLMGQEARKAANDAMAQEPHRKEMVIQQLFYHKHSAALYRQLVQYMSIDDEGHVHFTNLPYRGIRIPALPADIDEQQLSNHNAVRGKQVIKTGKRTPLGSFSPREKLLALSFEGMASRPYLLEYDTFQKRYFITVNKAEGDAETMTLLFLVQPDELPFAREALMVDKQIPVLMSDRQRQRVAAFFAAHPDIESMIGIQQGMDRSQKIEKIVRFVRQFIPERPSSPEVTLTLLLQKMEYGLGDCRYRSYIAAMLAEYYNVAIARVVSNNVNTFVELSVDGGVHWQGYDLEGYKFIGFNEKETGTELLKTGWDRLKELPTVKHEHKDKTGFNKDPRFFLSPEPLNSVLKDIKTLKGEPGKKALDYYKNLLLYFNADPSRMKDIPYLLLDDPKVRQKLSPWLNGQMKEIGTTHRFLNSEESGLMSVINPQLKGSPFSELEQRIKKRASSFKTVWKYQPPGPLQLNRLLENKAAFAHTSEHHELQPNRRVIFNVGQSPLLDPNKLASYQAILLGKLGKDKTSSMDSGTKKQLVEQALFDATYHLHGLAGQKTGVLLRRTKDDDTYGLTFDQPYGESTRQEAEWLWAKTILQFERALPTSVPLQFNLVGQEWLKRRWQDAVVIDGDMLHRLSVRYLESLSGEQAEAIRKAVSQQQGRH